MSKSHNVKSNENHANVSFNKKQCECKSNFTLCNDCKDELDDQIYVDKHYNLLDE